MLAIFLDTETTGLDFKKHRVLEIAFKAVDISTGVIVASYESIVSQPAEAWEVRDPTSTEINGFTWEKVCSGKPVSVVSQEIIQLLTDLKIQRGSSFFVCQNPSFDRCFFSQIVEVYLQEKMNWPYHWLDFASMYWALLVKKSRENQSDLPKQISFSKNGIAKSHQLPEETHPHHAMNGVDHLILCYQAVVGFPGSHKI